MFALNGLLLAYLEECNNLIVIYANQPNSYGGILTNFTLSQLIKRPPTNIALTPAGLIIVQAFYGYSLDEDTKILTYSGDLKFYSNTIIMKYKGIFGTTIDDDIVMCNNNSDIIKLTWSEDRPLWTTLFVGTQRSPWLCDRVLQVHLEGGMAWWIAEKYEERKIDENGVVSYDSSSRVAIYKQDADNNDVISMHYIISIKTSNHRPITMYDLAYDGDLSVFVTEEKQYEYLEPPYSAIIIHVFTTSGQYERELIRSRAGHELVSTYIAVDRHHKLLYTGHLKQRI